jgi:hypothetical protein
MSITGEDDAVVQLLRPPTEDETAAFFASLTPAVPDALEIRADADGSGGRGKGMERLDCSFKG